jgi:hypothetical protein
VWLVFFRAERGPQKQGVTERYPLQGLHPVDLPCSQVSKSVVAKTHVSDAKRGAASRLGDPETDPQVFFGPKKVFFFVENHGKIMGNPNEIWRFLAQI